MGKPLAIPYSHAGSHALGGSDQTSLDATQITSGVLAPAQVPVATGSAFGAVKPDGSTVTISGGILSAVSGGAGTVTSVALSLPADFTVTGSPITTSGTLTATRATQTANTVFAGPASGVAATPAYRALVAADLPVATGSAFGAVKPDGSTITISGGVLSAVSGGSGTVTSVGLSLPADFTVTGSPVTGAGTLTATRATQTANTVFAGPTTGAAAVPTYRALVVADIPAHASTHNVGGSDDIYLNSGNLSAARFDVVARNVIVTSSAAGNGTVYFQYFTAPAALTASNLVYAVGATAASGFGTGTSVIRAGIYTVDGSGNLTLVAATNNLFASGANQSGGSSNVAAFNLAQTVFLLPLSVAGDLSTAQTTYSFVRGTRYALGLIQYNTGGTPTFAVLFCGLASSGVGTVYSFTPRMNGGKSSQTDLPASVTAATVAATGFLPYAAVQ